MNAGHTANVTATVISSGTKPSPTATAPKIGKSAADVAVFVISTVSTTPTTIPYRHALEAVNLDPDPFAEAGRTEILIIDETDRLKTAGLERFGDYFDWALRPSHRCRFPCRRRVNGRPRDRPGVLLLPVETEYPRAISVAREKNHS